MATFRCKRSGNTVTFDDENDIKGMRNHEGYEEIKSEPEAPKPEIPVKEVPRKPDWEAEIEFAEDENRQSSDSRDANGQEVLKKRGRPRKG